jgi:hypothetical protein
VGAAAPPAAGAATGQVKVGVGRADITPITGGYKGGWSCTCATGQGVQERSYARAVVIAEGPTKVALVTEDLFAVSDGMVRDAIAELPGRGFDDTNVIVSATHTHSAQSGFMNFSSYNSVLPANSNPTFAGITNTKADQVMYDFMTHQLALAIRRADDDLRPGAVGWGQTQLLGVTQNRSLGAHLADFGITSGGANGGTVNQDPGGYADTIDPAVNVMRVDQYWRVKHGRRRRTERIPVGMYSTFANHGTDNHEDYLFFSADHFGAAERVVETAIRAAGHVPGRQDIVNAFADSDAGDMSSGIVNNGPAWAEQVGREEAAAELTAWRQAGHAMSTDPILDSRWTRTCFCGGDAGGQQTDSTPWIGLAAAAGSEEGRTVFYDDHIADEGDKLPVPIGAQGDKITALSQKGDLPQAAPFTAMRIGDRLIVTVPGEPTVGLGKMIRDSVTRTLGGSGIAQVVLVGYANEYLSYFTTPAEYEQQAYEGGFTLYGRYSGLILRDTLTTLAQRLVSGAAAPAPYPFDPSGGVHASTATYGNGARTATASAEPQTIARLGHASFSWHGGANGLDRPVDRAFVTIQRRVGRTWKAVTDDLGMQIAWSSNASGDYIARWEAPLTATPGPYRFVVTAKLYRLVSGTFSLVKGELLTPHVDGGSVTLQYPDPPSYYIEDWTWRPGTAAGGTVTFLVNGRRRVVRERTADTFPIPAGSAVSIPAGGARDRFGNANGQPLTIR